jgi:hypothetical protein
MFIHLQEDIYGNTHKRAKNMQENKAQIPSYTSPKERPTTRQNRAQMRGA